ncbi:MAG: nitrogen regulation protein NR(II) [Pseudomonadales bacterium]|nr:nitrogen regulation protein NR(II) [Pseudomonadales bacterium]
MTRNSKTKPDEVLFTKKSMESMFNVMNIAVLCVDHELNIRFINQSAESLLDISANRAINFSISELILNSEELESVLFDAIQIQNPYTQRRAVFKLYDGSSVTVDYTVTPWQYDNWPRLVIELYPLDRFLRIDRDEAFRSHQQVTRQMVRGLAHEIKNPLGGIRGAAQLLARELPTAELQEFTDVMISETDRLTSLVDRLLGPKSLPEPVSTNIHRLLERVRTLIHMESNAVIEVDRDYDPSIPEVTVDPELLIQAFLNIARNAVQSLREVEIQVAQSEPSWKPHLKFTTRTLRQHAIGQDFHRVVIKVDVQDNGKGVPENIRDQLFFPMITGRSDGTGLGLSIAHSIVHQHGGTIEFESEPGETIFSIILPLELTNELPA